MIHCRKAPATVSLAIASLFASFGFFAACGEPAEATLSTETHALMEPEQLDLGQEPASEGGDWMSRCTTDAECAVGQCTCGVCTESCSGEAGACSGSPAGSECYGGRTLPRAALCHATTVPGICLLPCSTDDDCGGGLVCALDVCMPAPEPAVAP